MHWRGGLLPKSQVALRVAAASRRDRQIVIVIDVTRCAGHIRMTVR